MPYSDFNQFDQPEASQAGFSSTLHPAPFTYTMSTPSAVPRTAPIAIAPKPSRFAQSRQGSINLDSYRGGSLHSASGFDSPDSDYSPLPGNPSVPCEGCQQRRIKCVMTEDDDSCITCQVNGAECSLAIESQHQRKRKLNGGDYQGDEGSHSKRR